MTRLSMRSSLIVAIFALGLLAVAVAILSGRVYHEHLGLHQQAQLSEQLRVGMHDLRERLNAQVGWFGAALESDAAFRASLTRRDAPAVVRRLESMMTREENQPGGDRLRRLAVLDPGLGTIASTPFIANPGGATTAAPCAGLRDKLLRRRDTETGRVLGGLCVPNGQAIYVVLAPIGARSVEGYIEAVFDVVPELNALEHTLGAALRLTLSDGRVLYESRPWRDVGQEPHAVRGHFDLYAHTTTKVNVALNAVRPASDVAESLDDSRHMLMLAMSIALLIAGYGALLVLERTTIIPLQRLTRRLRAIREDKDALGQPVTASGVSEVKELGEGFNAMTHQLKELYGSLEQMAFTDPLTQLPNRALFHDRLQQMIFTARRDNKSFALFMIDLDQFKDINDTLGHPLGDRLLQQVAERLRGKLRESDTIARMGGDEFAVLLPSVDDRHGATAAKMMLQSLRVPFELDEHLLDVGASIGIALYPEHGVDAHVLIQRADIAMYAAKHDGGGYRFYDAASDGHSASRLALMGELRRAVELEQFELYYQPKVDLRTGRVMGVEALVRWRHPNEGMILPNRFIPLLEQTGLIRSLTPWMLNESMQLSRRLQEQGVLITLSANLSVRDLQDPDLADTLLEQLAANQIDASMIELEITESAVMTEPERALAALKRLAEIGFRLAIDDFGTGYSSFAYLKKMPVGTLKLDKSFVTGVLEDENDAAIVRTSIDLAHNLGLKLVAEGVENGQILERLKALGCDAAQGLYISRPLPAAELTAWLRQSAWGLRDTPLRLGALR